MDLQLDDDQRALNAALDTLMRRHAGAERADAVGDTLDTALMGALASGGFMDVLSEGGVIEAVLVVEQAAAHLASAPVAASVLVAPLAGIRDVPPVVGLADRASGALVRYADAAELFLVLDGEDLVVAGRDQVDVEPVETVFGWPMGRVTLRTGDRRPGQASTVRRAWQTAIAVEAAALAKGAVRVAAEHVRSREQFGRPIGALQSVQHRLATAFVMSEATSLLARRAAWFNDDEFITASAATYACETARTVYVNTHQVSGAIGLASEFGLTRYTTRLVALQRELGGQSHHGRRVTASRLAKDLSGLPSPLPAVETVG